MIMQIRRHCDRSRRLGSWETARINDGGTQLRVRDDERYEAGSMSDLSIYNALI
jgi:hypothetical protein